MQCSIATNATCVILIAPERKKMMHRQNSKVEGVGRDEEVGKRGTLVKI
jgi:hypothetical protein